MPAPSSSIAWFNDARFGMFIHWGLYSIHGRDVWDMYLRQTKVAEYDKLADQFTPSHFNADEWAACAKDAGARYMVMCSRQHDGYALFDSAVSDFTSVKRAAGRDFIGEYVDAARRAGLGVGVYYSLLDWRRPEFWSGPRADPKGWAGYLDYVHTQVRELCTNYGKLDILWYDGAWPWTPEDWKSTELEAMVRELQPEILINDRAWAPGDFDTPEQHIPIKQQPRPWEACMTMNNHWGYGPTAPHEWKPTKELIANLVKCASGRGNFLLNVGPDPDGVFPKPSVERLAEMGRWLRVNGESVYGTEDTHALRHLVMPADLPWGPWEVSYLGLVPTVKGESLYAHVTDWPGSELTIWNVGSPIRSARFLDGGKEIEFRHEGPHVILSGLPARAPDPIDTVIVLECDGPPRTIDRFADDGDRMPNRN